MLGDDACPLAGQHDANLPWPNDILPVARICSAATPPNMMPPGTPQAQGGGRGRGPPIMSPAMYTGSPVMLHAVQVPQNHGFMPGRGQPRADNGQMPAQQQHLVHHPVSHNGFNAGPPPSPFVRSQW